MILQHKLDRYKNIILHEPVHWINGNVINFLHILSAECIRLMFSFDVAQRYLFYRKKSLYLFFLNDLYLH